MSPILDIRDLTVCYSGQPALNHVSFSINQGEFVAIMGPNGGGKTTLIRTVLGFLQPSEGSVSVATDKIGYVPQSSSVDRSFPITVREVLKTATLGAGLHPRLWHKKTDESRLDSCLEQAGLCEHYKDRQVSALSGGEFQRLLLARTLLSDPELLLLDEPTANVDPLSREQIHFALKKLAPEKTVVMVTHDISVLSGTVSRLICLGDRLLYDGAPTLTAAGLNAYWAGGEHHA